MKPYLLAAALALAPLPALAAGEAWESIRTGLYGEQPLLAGDDVITINAPYRTPDDARADLSAHITAPAGVSIAKLWVVLDENPMPVSAIFALENPLPRFYFDVTMRVNGPTPLHVVAETTDGRLWVSEVFVKTSGLGACSAPPGKDPKLALATLGTMDVELTGPVPSPDAVAQLASLSAPRENRMDVNIDHPSHSGMQMDQISLLFVPMRYVETVDIGLDGAGYVSVTGSISLSENPRIGISVPGGAQSVDVMMKDTDGTVSNLHKDLTGY